jgi:hypothetical protein
MIIGSLSYQRCSRERRRPGQPRPRPLPRDTTPPWTAPVVSVGEVGANYAHLSWTRAEDDGPYHYSYELWINGSLLYRSDYPRNVTNTVLRFLQPDTTYAVQIRTIDFAVTLALERSRLT